MDGFDCGHKGRRDNQKMKPYLIYQMLYHQTDENNVLSASDLIDMLGKLGIDAERRSIYTDIDAINKILWLLENGGAIHHCATAQHPLPKGQISLLHLFRPPQPTMRTDLDIGAKNPETTTVSGFFLCIFELRFHRYPPCFFVYRGGVELNTKVKLVENLRFL